MRPSTGTPGLLSKEPARSIGAHSKLIGLNPQVRCFSMERDAQFVYLALERCAAALHDVMEPLPGAAAPAVGGKPLHFQTAASGGNSGGGGGSGSSAPGSAAGAHAAGRAAGGARSATAAGGGGDSTALEPTPLAWAVSGGC